MVKIIQILHCSPSWVSQNLGENIFDGWQTRTAKALQRLNITNCSIECWVVEKQYRKTIVFQKDGIRYRIFPSFPLTYGREISVDLIKAIEAEKASPVILHIHGLFNWTTYLISLLFPELPIVVQQHGDCPPLYLLARRRRLFLFLPLLLFEEMFMRYVLKRIDHIFCLTSTVQNVLHLLGMKNKCSLQGMGVDFNLFVPSSKILSRKKLNLPVDKKIIVYVGKAYIYKGCDRVINAYQKLKAKYDIDLVMVGVSNADELYQSAVKAGAKIFSRVSHTELVDFYCSADVYVLPGSKIFNRWGGIGVSTIESLACNVPVVSGTLIHFPSNICAIGFYAENLEQIINGIEYIFNHPQSFNEVREQSQKYYDWRVISQNTLKIYQILLDKYYNLQLTFDTN